MNEDQFDAALHVARATHYSERTPEQERLLEIGDKDVEGRIADAVYIRTHDPNWLTDAVRSLADNDDFTRHIIGATEASGSSALIKLTSVRLDIYEWIERQTRMDAERGML